MQTRANLSAQEELLPLRMRYREEMNCQIVHDSIHRRDGWTRSFLLELKGATAGFGSVAIGGPWKGKPTVFEFYVLPEHRTRAFDLFESFLAASGARFFEVQTSDVLLAAMLHTYGRDIASEKIVFHDQLTTALPANGAVLRRITAEEEILAAIEERQGGGEWVLESDGAVAAKGGILFHYNRPYGDIYMEVPEPFRRRGFGSYFVQELKRVCYELGAVPGARCNPTNVASRRTLQRAGFVPFAHILTGSLNDSSTPTAATGKS
ncbi:MAG: GNAT family N-acetyltransferase [Verrucomicrobia bacterium]|nr:GNAT family N-acetyltransferase [Verrucomicrobiota bacterium]